MDAQLTTSVIDRDILNKAMRAKITMAVIQDSVAAIN
jgi:hypothetical protein